MSFSVLRADEDDNAMALKEKLTDREWTIANALAEGLSYAEIAVQLHISFHTVATHVKSILRKTGHRSSRKLAAEIRKLR
jgi:DNA-binding NarL/FixJ family response regulator